MNNNNNISSFYLLREKVASVFLAKHKHINADIKKWTGKDILVFQEDLQEAINTSISQKWFYTYFKKEAIEKLPRIDILNFLSEYVAYTNWIHFCEENNFTQEKKEDPEFDLDIPKTKIKQKSPRKKIYLIIGLGILALILYSIFPKEKTYHFCFVDQSVNIPITSLLQIIVLPNNESPVYLETQENGCFSYKTKQEKLKFVVQSPYYKTDTIVRYFDHNKTKEKVKLRADEYALILRYFSTSNVKDWNNRREELDKMIANKAKIYQVFGEEILGIDVLSKNAFINKMSLPTSSLRNMKILEIERKEQKIVKLKFEIKLDYE